MADINVCGMNEVGVDAFLDAAEQLDKGTSRFPWPDGFKAKVKDEINGMTLLDGVKRKVNALVLADLGPGLFGRGPYNLPVE